MFTGNNLKKNSEIKNSKFLSFEKYNYIVWEKSTIFFNIENKIYIYFTYLCDQKYSTQFSVKSKNRNQLYNTKPGITIKRSNIEANLVVMIQENEHTFS